VAESADAADLKSAAAKAACGFDSHLRHHSRARCQAVGFSSSRGDVRALVLALVAAALALPAAEAQQAWGPPLGVPHPPFGIVEQAGPPTHIVQEGAGCSDAGTGLLGPPRCTIPNPLSAGSVVEVRGTYTFRHADSRVFRVAGTAVAPAFIRGGAVRPLVTQARDVIGSYLVIENIEFAMAGGDRSVAFLSPSDHLVIRHSELRGHKGTPTRGAGGIALTSFGSASSNNLVVWNNRIHDNGDVNAAGDQDQHGISLGTRQSRVWILDNELYANSGDGLQINSLGTSDHIYAGRNVAHGNKQTGLSSKQASDVVFSQNHVYSHRASNSSNGACLGFQYNPERIWFLFNRLHDCDYGIAGESDLSTNGESVYVIGNLIYDIHTTTAFNPNTGWQHAAVRLTGGTNRFLINNTLHDVDTGIASPGRGNLRIHNNVISGVTRGSHVFVEEAPTSTSSSIGHNLLEGAVRIKWGSNTQRTLPALQEATGTCGGCQNASPGFLDAVAGDYRLQGSSPAVDAGLMYTDVFATFLRLYGIDIAVDFDGVPRPFGPAVDIGAYEAPTPPPPSRSTSKP
jgi:hypothetical protein